MSEIKSLIVKRIEKLFGKTVILNKEKKLDLEYKLDLRQWFIGLGLSF